MNKQLLKIITVLLLCCAVGAGVWATVSAVKDRNDQRPAASDSANAGATADQNDSNTGNDGQNGEASNPADVTTPDADGENGEDSGAAENGEGTANDRYAAKPGDDVSAYLIMGIDRHGEAGEVDDFHNGGQSDAMELLVFNDTQKTFAVIQINRDTMVEIDRLDIFGKPYTTTEAHICLAYSQGTGTEKSAENAVRATSRLFLDIPIDGYAALTFEGLPAINDALGGIKVKIEDDFSKDDPTLVMGETVELEGRHALNYVRGRMSVGDGSNVSRLRRQRTYLAAFRARLFEEMKVRSDVINDIYNAAKPYMVTNMSASLTSTLAAKAARYTDLGTIIPGGEFGKTTGANGITYNAFYADEDSIKSIVQRLFGTV